MHSTDRRDNREVKDIAYSRSTHTACCLEICRVLSKTKQKRNKLLQIQTRQENHGCTIKSYVELLAIHRPTVFRDRRWWLVFSFSFLFTFLVYYSFLHGLVLCFFFGRWSVKWTHSIRNVSILSACLFLLQKLIWICAEMTCLTPVDYHTHIYSGHDDDEEEKVRNSFICLSSSSPEERVKCGRKQTVLRGLAAAWHDDYLCQEQRIVGL